LIQTADYVVAWGMDVVDEAFKRVPTRPSQGGLEAVLVY
jgi:hypothetical protein